MFQKSQGNSLNLLCPVYTGAGGFFSVCLNQQGPFTQTRCDKAMRQCDKRKNLNLIYIFNTSLTLLRYVQCEYAIEIEMDAEMICGFTSFSTVFPSCQDDGRVNMKGSVQ